MYPLFYDAGGLGLHSPRFSGGRKVATPRPLFPKLKGVDIRVLQREAQANGLARDCAHVTALGPSHLTLQGITKKWRTISKCKTWQRLSPLVLDFHSDPPAAEVAKFSASVRPWKRSDFVTISPPLIGAFTETKPSRRNV